MGKLSKSVFISSNLLGTRVFIERSTPTNVSTLLDSNMEVLHALVNYARLKDLEIVTCNKNGQNRIWIEGLLVDLVPYHLRVTPDQIRLFSEAKAFSGIINTQAEAILYLGNLRITK